jgi:hypothetical protein
MGWLNGGMGAILIPGNDFDWQAHRQQQQKQTKEIKRNLQQRLSPLSDEKRDRAIRRMHSHIGLSQSDRQLLKEQRGMTDEQINRGLYFSLETYQDLPTGIPLNFPGVHWEGQTLNNRFKAIACPIFNEKGLVVGLQYRVLDDVGSRYQWPRSKFSSHLSNGELPITFIRPQNISKPHLGIVEGTGFKPQLAADRLGQVIIGAAGGQHISSPKQLKRYIHAAEAMGVNTEIIQVYIDAGDVLNHHVLNRLANQILLLESWGHEIEIAWWEQETKEQDDIDELSDLSPIQYIPVDHFQPIQPYLHRYEEDNELNDIEPNLEEYLAHCQAEEKEEAISTLEEGRRKVVQLENYPVAAKNAWRRRKQFSPKLQINQPYFDYQLPRKFDHLLVGVKSPLGTGKTEWIKRLIQQNPNEGWLAFGYRNSLLLQTAERCGFLHLHEHDAFQLIANPKENICCCVDSLIHFRPEDFDDKYVVIDEVMSVVSHLLAGGTLKDRKDKVLTLWEEVFKRAKCIILLDGHLADWCVQYLQKLTVNNTELLTVENCYIDPTPISVDFLEGVEGKKALNTQDRSPLLTKIKEACHPDMGLRPVIATDSQIQCEALDNILKEDGYSGIRIDSKTISEKWCKDFLSNPDTWIEQNQPDYIVYSPSAEAGLDISTRNYFTHHFCLFFGVLGVDPQLQMMGRLRDRSIRKIVWAAQFTRNGRENFRSPFAITIEKSIIQHLLQDVLLTVDGLPDATAITQKLTSLIHHSQDLHFQTACLIAAIANYEKANLRSCLLETLESGNYEVMEFVAEPDGQAKDALKEAVNEVKNQNAQDIYTAKDLDSKLALGLDGMFGTDWETRCSIIKARLKATLPGIENKPIWSREFIRLVEYNDKQFIQSCELFWLLHHPEVAQRLNQDKWAWNSRQDKIYLKSVKSRYSPVWALRKAGFLELLAPNREWLGDSPEILKFHRQCKASKKLQLALGMSVGQSTPNQWFERCLRKVGLKTAKKQMRVGKERFWVYWIDSESWDNPYRQTILEILPQRWAKYLSDSCTTPEFCLETSTPSGVESVINPPVNINETGESVTSESIPDIYQAQVNDVVNCFEDSIGESAQTVRDLIVVIKDIFASVPQAKRWIFSSLSPSAKNWLFQSSPEDYRWLLEDNII